MRHADWGALSSSLLRQNSAFVAAFTAVAWECLIAVPQEIEHLWHCSSKVTKYHYWFCRYSAIIYFILSFTFGIQWALDTSTQRVDCEVWFLMNTAFLGLQFTGSQFIFIRKIFNLYDRSPILGAVLAILQITQGIGTFAWCHHIAHSLNFNPICNGENLSKLAFCVLATGAFNRVVTWGLLLRKSWKYEPGLLSRCGRYLCTSDAHAKLAWVVCFAIMINTSHSFSHQRFAQVYVFTFPIAVLSIGTCRYILQAEKDRCAQATLTEAVAMNRLDKGKGKDLPALDLPPQPYPPIPPQKAPQCPVPSPQSDAEATPRRISDSSIARRQLDPEPSNFPYIHGFQAYSLKRKRYRSSTSTAGTSNISSRISFACATEDTPSLQMPWSGTGSASSMYPPDEADSVWIRDFATKSELGSTLEVDVKPGRHPPEAEVGCEADIEVGSLQFKSSSSLDSEDLRRFDEQTYYAHHAGSYWAGR